jgi:hypothetical protein
MASYMLFHSFYVFFL